MLIATVGLGCMPDAATPHADGGPVARELVVYPEKLTTQKVDFLFVIDNSRSMESKQERLQQGFHRLLAGLRYPTLDGWLPNLRIGVVSTDLGTDPFPVPSCGRPGGDGGRLQQTPRFTGCPTLADPWISVSDGATNIVGCEDDSLACVDRSFGCLVRLGEQGCAFEAPLESARRALDPALAVNPGFLRSDALLVVVFLTDEDDCSVRDPELFRQQPPGKPDPLGPLDSYRCFAFGIRCDATPLDPTGPRENCEPAFDWLYRVEDYVSFFAGLKQSKGGVLMAAIAGPPTPVVVRKQGEELTLESTCSATTDVAAAWPAIRLSRVVEAFGGPLISICRPVYEESLLALGRQIVSRLAVHCLPGPLLLPNGGLGCAAGVDVCTMPACQTAAGERCDLTRGDCMKEGHPTGTYCGESCLDKAECIVAQVSQRGTANEQREEIAKCPQELFTDPELPRQQCGEHCPCWRIVPQPATCPSTLGVSPFALEVMRAGPLPKNSETEASCRGSSLAWSSPEVQQAAVHCAR